VFCTKNNEKYLCKHGSLEASFSSYGPFEKRGTKRCLWDNLKSTVYATAVTDVAELQRRVEDGCELIRNATGVFKRVRLFLIISAARVWKHKDNALSTFCNLLSKQ
jgi:hypothetical protein